MTLEAERRHCEGDDHLHCARPCRRFQRLSWNFLNSNADKQGSEDLNWLLYVALKGHFFNAAPPACAVQSCPGPIVSSSSLPAATFRTHVQSVQWRKKMLSSSCTSCLYIGFINWIAFLFWVVRLHCLAKSILLRFLLKKFYPTKNSSSSSCADFVLVHLKMKTK